MAGEASSYRAKDRSLDQLMDDFDRGLPQGEGKGSDPTLVGFQYRVAKEQQRWTWISVGISIASVIVATAAVVVAALK